MNRDIHRFFPRILFHTRALLLTYIGIQEMHEYDWDLFKAARIEAMHTQDMGFHPEDDDDESMMDSPLLKKFFEQFTTQYDTYSSHPRYWWLEELNDEDSGEADLLVQRLNMLNQEMMALVDMTLRAELSVEENEQKFKTISDEIAQLTERLEAVRQAGKTDGQRLEQAAELERSIESLKNCGCEYNDNAVRQMIECIRVYPDGKLDIIFNGGFTVVEHFDVK